MNDSGARSLILGRIRDVVVANGQRTETAAAEHSRIERTYNHGPSLPRDSCLQLFIDRLKHYQVEVHLCSRSEIAATVAGMVAARRSCRLACRISSVRSGRLTGSPPLKTISGVPMRATSSMSRLPSAVVSSSGSRNGRAEARQWRHASPHACVVSQITRKGDRSKSTRAKRPPIPDFTQAV